MANNEWMTPSKYIESARKVMGSIDLDPASNDDAQLVIKARQWNTAAYGDETFNYKWEGNVWLNPPYGVGLAKPFTKKLCDSYLGGSVNQAVVLTNNTTDTYWFSDTLGEYAAAYCFPRLRIQFTPPTGTKQSSNSKGQVFSYFGKNIAAFIAEFQQYGLCVIPWRS